MARNDRAVPGVSASMNNMLDVIFLGKNDAKHAQLAEALSQLGFSVRRCHNLTGVCDRYSNRPSPLIILEAPLPDIHNAAARLRAIDRGLGIVAITPFSTEENRIRTLLCGADACLPPETAGLELAAVLQALARRAAGFDLMVEAAPDDPPRPTWRLTNKGWTLISPAGHRLGLTTGERDFLTRLVKAPDRKLSRDAFCPNGAKDADGTVTRRRFVDVMISRLRRKASARHMTLPIRAVHGWGYMFTADIALELKPQEEYEDGRPDEQDDWRDRAQDAKAPSH